MAQADNAGAGSTTTDAGAAGDKGATGAAGSGTPAGASQTSLSDKASQDTGKAGDQGSDTQNKDAKDQADADSAKDDKAPVVPEKYELKLPDGVFVDDGLMKEFTAVGHELKWDAATAQRMADMHLKAIGLYADKQSQEWESKVLDWHNELKDDKEIGGAKIDETMKQARKMVQMAGTIPGVNAKRLMSDLTDSGLATHPDLVRVFHFLGQFVGEDNKFITGFPTSSNAPKDAATILYGKTGVKEK